jgi:hypothetical protein
MLVANRVSIDDTVLLSVDAQPNWPQLRYVRLPKSGGIDADLAESIRLARDEYFWLFSGDAYNAHWSFRAGYAVAGAKPRRFCI